MKHTNHKRLKSIVAGSLSVAMLAPLINSLPVQALKNDVKIYSYDDFEIQYQVTGEWKNHQNIMVTVINKTDEPIYNWAFKYNANGKIGKIWGAETLDCLDNEYVIGSVNYDSKIKNSVSFGYILECDDETVDVPEDFTLCTKRVDIDTGYSIDSTLKYEWADSYIGEISITNTSEEPIVGWHLSLDSLNKITTVWNGEIIDSTDNSYIIAPGTYGYYIDPGDTVKVGFIADKTDDAEFNVDLKNVSAVVRDWSFDTTPDFTDPKDTDGDLLPDVYEKHVYGTDPKKADTDGDKLPDGYEVIPLKTNPREADSDNNKITDDKEDFDSDKLTNLEEYELGTNPFVADTDEDGLSDYDEVKKYGTDPLKVDTDDDTVWDGDEIKLGLDPTDSSDGGTPVKQTVSEDDLEINEYNDDFKISLDLTASNYVPDYLEQEESPYSGILSDNRSIIGTPINLSYTGGTITEGTIKFRMNEETVNGSSHYFEGYDVGLERYGVFVYDEEIGTIIPVPAEYDEENLTISIDASSFMGNLMIIDYEALMYDLGIDPRVEEPEKPEVIAEDPDKTEEDSDKPAAEAEAAEETTGSEAVDALAADIADDEEAAEPESDESVEEESDTEYAFLESESMMSSPVKLAAAPKAAPPKASRQVDLVIVIDTTGSMGGAISKVRTNLTNLIDKLRDDNITLYASIIDFKDITCDEPTILNNNNGKQFYSSIDDIKSAISGMRARGGGDDPETDVDGLGMACNLNYRSSASKYLFLITDTGYKIDNNYGYTSLQQVADKLHEKDVMTNIIVPTSRYSTYAPLVSDPDKSKIDVYSDFCDAMYEIISAGNVDADTVILGSNFVTGSFKSKLTYGGPENSDTDGLTDSEEVNWDYIDLDKTTGVYTLPKWEELCNNSKFMNPYKYGKTNISFSKLKDIQVVPAYSNPFSSDTDGDYYPDDEEPVNDRAIRNNMYINDAALNDSEYNKGENFTGEESDKYTDGKFYFSTCEGPAKTQQRSWYSFIRKTNTTYYFDLKPESTSFYKFDSDAALHRSIKITYKSWGKTKTVSPESDGTYLLEGDTDYTIKFYTEADYSGTYTDYSFTVSQDNWIYIPKGYGCYQTISKYSNAGSWTSIPFNNGYYLTQELFYAIIGDLVGSEFDLNATDEVNKIMRDLGYLDSQYEITGKEVAAVVVSDVILVLSIYSLGATAAASGSGYAVLFATKANAASTVAGIGSIGYDVVFTPHIDLFKKMLHFLEKKDMEDTLKECESSSTGRYDIACSNYIGIGLNNLWEPWTTNGYVYKFDSYHDVLNTEFLDPSDITRIEDAMSWS